MRRRDFLLSLILFFCISSLNGQQSFFMQFSVAEGLAQSTVYAVYQDRNDLYWLGTQAGISSFDGKDFINFAAGDNIASNGVRAICEDSEGRIWFGHNGGGITLKDDEGFRRISGIDSLVSSTITSMTTDTSGQLWITTEASGLILVKNPLVHDGELDAIQFAGSEISDRVYDSYLSPDGTLYFITDLNVKQFNPDPARFNNLLTEGVPVYYNTTSMLVDRQGSTWIGKFNGGLYRHDPFTGETRMFDLIKAGLSSNWVTSLYEDPQGNIWAGTWGGGLACIRPAGDMDLYTGSNGLPGMKIRTISGDVEGNILIGTQEAGLCAFRGDSFVSWYENDGLSDSRVWSVLEASDGSIWIGTGKGISIMDREGRIRTFGHLEDVRVTCLREDSRSTIWIGTLDQGVYSYSSSGRFIYDPRINNNIYHQEVTGMDLDAQDNLWIGTMDGLVYYEITSGRGDLLTQGSREKGLLSSNISHVYADSKDRIWVGSQSRGLSVISGAEIIPLDPGFSFTPRCMTEDLDGNVWVGTEGRGIMVFDGITLEIKEVLREEDGLLANLINQLECDRFNNVYVGTNKGLNLFQRSNGHLYCFTPGSGFVGIETNACASMAGSNGDLWFGTVLGLTRYSPGKGEIQAMEPRVHITGFEVNHQAFELKPGQRFSHKQNSMVFDYHCMSLNQDAVRYSIMMDGVDMEWREPGIHSRVTYPALRPGKYTFRVKARSSEGVWNITPAEFYFEIRPPFYARWWFILSLVVGLGLAIIAYIKMRERALRRENAILEEKVAHRTALVVSQKEELAQKNQDITSSIRYAKRIQFAILPEKPPYEDTFVLFKPKAIVSGDFYWFHKVDGREYMAAVDCTGHGVPGAFMSIIGHNSLNKIVMEYGIRKPGEILSCLNREVISTLVQRSDASEVLDGMDLALVCYHPGEGKLEYAGAFNPLYLVRDGEILETQADKVSIGRSSFNEGIHFTNHSLDLIKGDAIYLFSDGYADQFGGPSMKKFKYRALKELILRIQDQSMEQQRMILDQTIEDWMGDLDQLDDILVMGRRC